MIRAVKWLENRARRLTGRLHGKKLLWTQYIKVFCDGGNPRFRWRPRVRRQHYAAFWGLYGFAVYWGGRELTFCFGEDRKGLYRNCKG